MNTPAVERLRFLFSYDPVTGKLVHAVRRSGVRYLSEAGSFGNRGYLMVYVDGHNLLLHRVIWCMLHGSFPLHQIDHINRNRTDNRLCNLRLATNKQNSENHPLRSDSKSLVTGICWSPHKGKWRAYIQHLGKQLHIGYFAAKDDAIKARSKAAKSLFTHSEQN